MSTIMHALSFERLIYTIPAILIAMTFHEMAHGFVSYKLGDPTPKEEGRLSFNPFHHLDPFGTLSMLLLGFGWAKPVQIDARYYDDPKSGLMWTAVAGPLMNFLVALLCYVLAAILMKVFGIYAMFDGGFIGYFVRLCIISAQLNISLGIFNLIPIPPLDGSKVLAGLLPDNMYLKLLQMEQYFGIILIVVLFSGMLDGPLFGATNSIMNAMSNMVFHLFGIY